MPTALAEKAVEKSTFVISASFYDESDPPVLVTPNTISWKLTDEFGGQISGALGTIAPSSTVDIVLSGDNLIITSEGHLVRLLYVETTYDSNLGSNLPLKDYVRFEIDPIRVVS